MDYRLLMLYAYQGIWIFILQGIIYSILINQDFALNTLVKLPWLGLMNIGWIL